MLPGVIGLRGPFSCLNEARYGIAWGAVGAARDSFDAALTPGDYQIKARSAEEAEFLGIGHGAAAWLVEAAAAGPQRMNQKMREAVQLARIHGIEVVDEALGVAAAYGRFDTGDLASILGAKASSLAVRHASETRSLAQGTRGWASIGQPAAGRPIDEITATSAEAEL